MRTQPVLSNLAVRSSRQALIVAMLFGAAVASQAALELRLALLDGPVAKPTHRRSAEEGRLQRTLRRGDAISVRVELKNVGNSEESVFPSLDPAAGFLSFWIASDGAAPERISTIRWQIRDIYVRPRPLRPGETLTFETFLFGRLARGLELQYLLPDGGKYRMSALFQSENPRQGVRSNDVEILAQGTLESWDGLVDDGIVDLVEGRERPTTGSRDERRAVATRQTQLRERIRNDKAHPLRPWVREKPAERNGSARGAQ